MRGGAEVHRRVLGVGVSAGHQEIKDTFRRLALLHHPDRGGKREDFERIVAAGISGEPFPVSD